jgi:hypothetical protein
MEFSCYQNLIKSVSFIVIVYTLFCSDIYSQNFAKNTDDTSFHLTNSIDHNSDIAQTLIQKNTLYNQKNQFNFSALDNASNSQKIDYYDDLVLHYMFQLFYKDDYMIIPMHNDIIIGLENNDDLKHTSLKYIKVKIHVRKILRDKLKNILYNNFKKYYSFNSQNKKNNILKLDSHSFKNFEEISNSLLLI